MKKPGGGGNPQQQDANGSTYVPKANKYSLSENATAVILRWIPSRGR
jgi:hypothetical protein